MFKYRNFIKFNMNQNVVNKKNIVLIFIKENDKIKRRGESVKGVDTYNFSFNLY